MLGRRGPLIFLLFSAAYAHAHAEALPYHIEYDAKPDCSSREDFVRELTARTPLVREAAEHEDAATFSVKLLENGESIAGQLVLRETNGTETRRGIAGQSCDEVVPALALIAAVLVDPEALTRGQGEPERTVAPERSEKKPSRFRFGAAAGASLEGAVSPNLAYGAFLELSAETERAGRRGFAFGVGAHRTWSEPFESADGDADFTWTAARGWFCPVSLPDRGVFAFAPCASVEAGQLHADSSNTLDESDTSVFWLAAGPLGRLELRPTRAFSVFADGLAVFPLLRPYHFRFDPATPVYSTPVVSWAAQAGVRILVP